MHPCGTTSRPSRRSRSRSRSVSCSTIRVACATSSSIRPSTTAAIASRPPVGRHARAQIPRQALLGARQELALLEHELPAPRDGRGGRRQEAARRPGPAALPRAARARPHLVSARGSAADRRRPRLSIHLDLDGGARYRSDRRDAAGPIHIGRHGRRWCGRVRLDGSGSRALGAGLVRRPRSSDPNTLPRWSIRAPTAALKSSIPYGYGTQVVEIDGLRTLGHSGRLLGFRSAMRYIPDQGVSIAVVTNQSRTDPAPIVRSLLKLALTPVDRTCVCRVRR